MRFFRTEPPPVRPPVIPHRPIAATAKPSVLDGWSESEMVSVCNAAPVKQLKKGAPVFAETLQTDSFFILLNGAIQLTVNLNGQPGWPGMFQKGDCVAPLFQSPGLSYCA